MGGLLPQASTFGPAVDSLFMMVLIVTGVAFVLVEGLLVYFLIRYRHRPGQKAAYIHGNHRVELAWTIIPGFMLFFLALYQRGTWATMKQQLPDESKSVLVAVSAKQFEWHATYAGADGRLDTADDVVAPINILHVPLNQPVIVRLTAQDVIHSFFIPAFRLKQDAVPGMTIRLWFQATQTGEYELACAELCGLGHYRMRGHVTVDSPDDFKAWLAKVQTEQSGGQ